MKSFVDYYYELQNSPPEKYKETGEFGKGCWHHMVSEGLITSYPKEKVEEYVKNLHTGDDYEIFYGYDKHLVKVYITPIKNEFETILKNLSNGLKVYGYHVGKITTDHFGGKSVLIEPIHSSESDETFDTLFHVTHKKFLPKIMKNGLSPRESTTIFTHPGGRIYLFHTNDMSYADQLKFQLSSQRIPPNPNIPNDLKYAPENMVTLKVKNAQNLKLSVDPMVDGGNHFKGFFTTQNIPPDQLEIVD